MSFEKIKGNNDIKALLENAIKENHILHSYLFAGIEGIGKILFAKEFAKQILCLEDEQNLDSYLKWESNNHPDFLLIEPENKTIKIEQIRSMQEKIAEKPIIANKKVYIIADCECMTKEAQNCLLKTIEEPQEYAIIILTTSNESKLLNTIKSRCIKILFKPLNKEDIKAYLLEQKQELPPETFFTMSEGSIGRIMSLIEDRQLYNEINNILDQIDKKDLITILNEANILYKQKEKIQEILNYFNIYLYNSKDIKKINAIRHVEDVKRRIYANSNYDMSIDYLLIKIWEEVH